MIREINHFAELLTVEFDEGKMVEYSFTQLEELELAYAITIHKSQGSEYPAVVIPFQRAQNVNDQELDLYGGNQGKAERLPVGLPETFQAMAANTMEQRRYCGLKDRILELKPQMI